MILNPEMECMPREELKKLQSERLVWQVKRMYENVECFRNRMDEKGLKPEDIRGIEDLSKLPFSYKSDLRDYYPYGLFAVSLDDIVRVHASSGTTGKRIVVGYTRDDLKMWSECFARMLSALGVTKSDVVQVGHHGCGNVSRGCYELIDAKAYIWQCGEKFWYQDSGEGLNTHNVGFIRYRAFMKEIGVKNENIYVTLGDIDSFPLPMPIY